MSLSMVTVLMRFDAGAPHQVMMPAFAAFATRADGTIQQDHYVIATFVCWQCRKSRHVRTFAG